jgi:hypothetical protein
MSCCSMRAPSDLDDRQLEDGHMHVDLDLRKVTFVSRENVVHSQLCGSRPGFPG